MGVFDSIRDKSGNIQAILIGVLGMNSVEVPF